jgi:hypothetical protein
MTEIPDAVVTKDAVYIGGQIVPGLIEKEGITVTPGGADACNRLTLTLIVGRVEVEDPTTEQGNR